MRNAKSLSTKIYGTKATSYLVILLAIIFAAFVWFTFSPQSPLFHNQSEKYSVLSVQTKEKLDNNNQKKNTEAQLNTPTKTTSTTSNKILGINIISTSPIPKPVINVDNQKTAIPSPTQTTNQANSSGSTNTQSSLQNNTSNNAATTSTAPTSTPIPLSPTPPDTQTIAVVSTVNVEIKAPDASTNFSMVIKEGMNVCDVMQKAKDEGKIKSLTFDDSYLSAFHSRYVYEINGYKNNWTFTVNGSSPLGCSLSTPIPNDSIVWKFS